MSDRSDATSLRLLRLRARLPRYLAVSAVAFLSLAGLRAVLEGQSAVAPAAPVAAGVDRSAAGFAESFARAYLSWDADRPEAYERRLRSYMAAAAIDEGAPLLPTVGRDSVRWTAAMAERAVSGSRTVVTVASETDVGVVYLAVPVSRDGRGFMRVDAAPAIVGGPPVSHSGELPSEPEVENAGLARVATRALRNYLAGERANLLADLASDAVVSLPDTPLRVRSVEAPTWVIPGRRLAVMVDARRADGMELRLRYELEVVRSDRWYVRSIGTDLTNRGGS